MKTWTRTFRIKQNSRPESFQVFRPWFACSRFPQQECRSSIWSSSGFHRWKSGRIWITLLFDQLKRKKNPHTIASPRLTRFLLSFPFVRIILAQFSSNKTLALWFASPGSTASYTVKQLSQSAIFRSSSFSGRSAMVRKLHQRTQHDKAPSWRQTFVVITGNIAIHQTQHVLRLHHQQMVVMDVLWMLKNELLELLGTFFNKTI